jgi:hypothetical protein
MCALNSGMLRDLSGTKEVAVKKSDIAARSRSAQWL